MNTLSAEAERPPLHFIDTEADRLSGMAMTVQSRIPSVASMLMDEINRGEIHDAEDMPEGVVTMLSTVEFVDEGSGTRRTVQLVRSEEHTSELQSLMSISYAVFS